MLTHPHTAPLRQTIGSTETSEAHVHPIGRRQRDLIGTNADLISDLGTNPALDGYHSMSAKEHPYALLE
jgi:hypothetical protein